MHEKHPGMIVGIRNGYQGFVAHYGHDVVELTPRFAEILRADFVRSDAGRTADSLKGAIGGAHGGIFDFDAMSRLLTRAAPKAAMPPRRRQRIEALLGVLEEVGELANELLADLELQRKDKLKDFKSENIAKELVDVLFTAFILGITLDIDIEKAIKERLNDINNRVHI